MRVKSARIWWLERDQSSSPQIRKRKGDIKAQPYILSRLNQVAALKFKNSWSIEWLIELGWATPSNSGWLISQCQLTSQSNSSRPFSSLASPRTMTSSSSHSTLRRREVSWAHLDLVPLIDKSQLYSRKINYLHVRPVSQAATSIEKPLLLKKRNVPAIGMTLLDACEPEVVKKQMSPWVGL